MIKASGKGFQHRIDPKQQNPRDTAPLTLSISSSMRDLTSTAVYHLWKLSLLVGNSYQKAQQNVMTSETKTINTLYQVIHGSTQKLNTDKD